MKHDPRTAEELTGVREDPKVDSHQTIEKMIIMVSQRRGCRGKRSAPTTDRTRPAACAPLPLTV